MTLPASLQNILDSTGYLEFDIDILNLDISTDPIKAELKISNTEGYSATTTALMTVSGCVDFHISKEELSSYLHMTDDSPLLWRFTDTICELYISGGQPRQFEKTVFDLLKIHYSLFGQYLPFDLQFMTILNNGHGLLQKGPERLLTRFANCLNNNGIKTSLIKGPAPDKRKQDLKVLFLEKGYFIAREFDFLRLGSWGTNRGF